MKKITTLVEAKRIMGDNIITPDDLKKLINLQFVIKQDTAVVPFSSEEIRNKSRDYILIYGCSEFLNNKVVNIKNLKLFFGDDPSKSEPCFYFQDWYNKESFITAPMKEGWFFIKRKVYEESRAVFPDALKNHYFLPSAVQCTYSFFVVWLVLREKLWYHDFVWCEDVDHNGDRVYVGKYNDVDGINKNGFSIHRHLSLRKCYGCIDLF